MSNPFLIVLDNKIWAHISNARVTWLETVCKCTLELDKTLFNLLFFFNFFFFTLNLFPKIKETITLHVYILTYNKTTQPMPNRANIHCVWKCAFSPCLFNLYVYIDLFIFRCPPWGRCRQIRHPRVNWLGQEKRRGRQEGDAGKQVCPQGPPSSLLPHP